MRYQTGWRCEQCGRITKLGCEDHNVYFVMGSQFIKAFCVWCMSDHDPEKWPEIEKVTAGTIVGVYRDQ